MVEDEFLEQVMRLVRTHLENNESTVEFIEPGRLSKSQI